MPQSGEVFFRRCHDVSLQVLILDAAFRRHPVGVERCSICNYFCGKGRKIQASKQQRHQVYHLGKVFGFFSGQGVEAKKWLVETPLERKNVRMKAN